MAFTEEQEQMILASMEQMKSFFDKQSENKTTPPNEENVLDNAKKAFEEQKTSQEQHAAMEDAIKFNLGIGKFVEDFKQFLPETTSALLDEVNKKNYSTETLKANAIRSGIIQSFIELKQNFDILPETMKNKALRFKALTADEKEKQSGSFWDVVEVGATHRQLTSKAQALQKANGVSNATGEESAHRARFLALGEKWKRKD